MADIRYGQGREALLAATVRLIGKYGLAQFTFRNVADEAGVNNTLISRHFGNKKNLLKAAMSWATARSVNLSELANIGDVDSKFVERLLSLVQEEPEHQMFQYEMLLASRQRPELRDDAVALYNGYITALEHGLRNRGHNDPMALAQAIFAALDGLVIQRLTVMDSDSVKSAMLRVGQLLQLDRNVTNHRDSAARKVGSD